MLAVISVAALYLVVILSFWLGNKSKIYPGVSVAGVNLSGKTQKEAEEDLRKKIADWSSQKITLEPGKEQVSPADLGIQFDIEKTAKEAVGIGAKNPFILGAKTDLTIETSFDAGPLIKSADKTAQKSKTSVVNSKVEKKSGEITVVNGTPGGRINYAETAQNLKETVGNLKSEVAIATFFVPPTFTDADLAEKMPEITEKSKNGLTLSDGSSSYSVDSGTIVTWVSLAQPKTVYARMFSGDQFFAPIYLATNESSIFSTALVGDYLMGLSGKINTTPVNARLATSGGSAVISVPSKDGRNLNVEKSASDVVTALDANETTTELTVEVKKAEINETSISELGITELLSTGYSNFSGSPANRLHNIRTGASKFNGVLIKPDQSFSFIETLGPVDASTGYLPELVIKENKTVPEYGGGMCQVSSTAFRAALNGGLPILERLYHAYPVQYYKPYGVDATVYIPHPDLVFKNDTGHYILIQTRIEGSRLTFDFYGTKPARTIKFAGNAEASGAVFPVEQVSPAIYDQEARGQGSFTAAFWRFIYDSSGKLITKSNWVSKYDTPTKYPH